MSSPANDPLSVLGLDAGADADAIREARRQHARRAHPDRGGSLAAMQQINAAADAALRALSVAPSSPQSGARTPKPKRHRDTSWRGGRRDHPSFTIEALPVEAFEALQIVIGWHGDLVDDDPPYHVSFAMSEPVAAWCVVDIVPDAGASSISLTVGRVNGAPQPDVLVVRDALISSLNRLDWTELDPNQPRPF